MSFKYAIFNIILKGISLLIYTFRYQGLLLQEKIKELLELYYYILLTKYLFLVRMFKIKY